MFIFNNFFLNKESIILDVDHRHSDIHLSKNRMKSKKKLAKKRLKRGKNTYNFQNRNFCPQFIGKDFRYEQSNVLKHYNCNH